MYTIRKFKSRRQKTDYIILCHSINLIKKDLRINPIVRRGTYKLTWDIWQEYFMHTQQLLDVPCHFYTELLNEDYVIFTGLPIQKKSSYLEELANNGIIQPQFKNAVLVMIGENFEYDLPEERMFEHISNRIISPVSYQYKIPLERVVLFDDCLTTNWKENLENSNLNYEITLNKYFNMTRFRTIATQFSKLIVGSGYGLLQPIDRI